MFEGLSMVFFLSLVFCLAIASSLYCVIYLAIYLASASC